LRNACRASEDFHASPSSAELSPNSCEEMSSSRVNMFCHWSASAEMCAGCWFMIWRWIISMVGPPLPSPLGGMVNLVFGSSCGVWYQSPAPFGPPEV
jgi:hypothetical protein